MVDIENTRHSLNRSEDRLVSLTVTSGGFVSLSRNVESQQALNKGSSSLSENEDAEERESQNREMNFRSGGCEATPDIENSFEENWSNGH